MPPEAEHPTGVIGVVRLIGWSRWCEVRASSRERADRVRAARRSRWFRGPVGWALDEHARVALATPVPMGGHQRLWYLTHDEAALVLDELARTVGVDP